MLFKIRWISGPQSVVAKLPEWSSLGNLLERKSLRPHSVPTKSEAGSKNFKMYLTRVPNYYIAQWSLRTTRLGYVVGKINPSDLTEQNCMSLKSKV